MLPQLFLYGFAYLAVVFALVAIAWEAVDIISSTSRPSHGLNQILTLAAITFAILILALK